MTEYNDDRYQQLLEAMSDIVTELLEMEGNTPDLISSEFTNILENR